MSDSLEQLPESQVHARIGDEGFARLCNAFFAMVRTDDLLGPLYEAAVAATGETLLDAERKLCAFLIFRFGGPDAYVQERGHPRLRARHMRFPVDGRGAGRWLELMERAMVQAALDEQVCAALRPYLRETAKFMMNRA